MNKSSSEYQLMREAIGQIMTGCALTVDMIPVVSVPYTEKTYNLAKKWVEYPQMNSIGIKFYLIKPDGDIVIV